MTMTMKKQLKRNTNNMPTVRHAEKVDSRQLTLPIVSTPPAPVKPPANGQETKALAKNLTILTRLGGATVATMTVMMKGDVAAELVNADLKNVEVRVVTDKVAMRLQPGHNVTLLPRPKMTRTKAPSGLVARYTVECKTVEGETLTEKGFADKVAQVKEMNASLTRTMAKMGLMVVITEVRYYSKAGTLLAAANRQIHRGGATAIPFEEV